MIQIKKVLLFKILNRIAKADYSANIYRNEIEKVINDKKPHFLYLDIKRPANNDIMTWLSLSNFESLRVSVFKIKPFKSRILNSIFPVKTIEKIIFGLFNHPAVKK